MGQTADTIEFLRPAARQELAAVCARHRINWLAVFGSVARGDARPGSDVDLLVEFEPEAAIGYIMLEKVAEDLSRFFGGRYVDIGRPKQLHWMIRDRVLAEARVLYAR